MNDASKCVRVNEKKTIPSSVSRWHTDASHKLKAGFLFSLHFLDFDTHVIDMNVT